MATHRTMEERLAAAIAKQEKAAAQVRALEVRRRAETARERQRGEKTALDLLLKGVAADASLADALWALADKAELPPDRRAALALVIGAPHATPSKSKAA